MILLLEAITWPDAIVMLGLFAFLAIALIVVTGGFNRNKRG